MKYINPLSISCPSCDASGDYNPRDLVSLQASCMVCGRSLQEIGEEMRKELTEWAVFVAKSDIAIELEKKP